MRSSLFLAVVAVLAGVNVPDARAAHVNVIELDNQIISPVTQQYIEEAIKTSEQDGAVCLVVLLDTPGGLLESTRGIVKRIMNARVPVVVYVAPSGSRAGSAGVFITLAAHVAAMAPSTNIGAAHPVVVGEDGGFAKKLIRRIAPREEGKDAADAPDEDAADRGDSETVREVVEEQEISPMAEKVMNDTLAWVSTIARARNRNVEWAKRSVAESVSATETEAHELGIVDLVAADLPSLLQAIDGVAVELAGTPVELATAGAEVVRIPMNPRQQFLATITNPNVAYLLMMFGTFGLIFEFTHPGIGFPGIAGLICLLLALYAFQALPVSYVAIALVGLGLILLVAEAMIVSHGLLALGGVISLTLGSLMLVESPNPDLRVSLSVILPTVLTLSAIILFIVHRAFRAQFLRVTTGSQGLVGEIGTAVTDLAPGGRVFVHGEYWNATSGAPIQQGEKIRVLRLQGLELVVEKAS